MSGTEFYSPLDASERILASGRPLAPREFVTLTEEEQEDPHNARLIAEGQLIEVVMVEQTHKELLDIATGLDITGRGSMKKDQLKKAIADKQAELEAANEEVSP